jgi:hypothetical protein
VCVRARACVRACVWGGCVLNVIVISGTEHSVIGDRQVILTPNDRSGT